MTAHDHRPVLLATDGEPGSDAALRFAAREASARGCGLTLLHVYPCSRPVPRPHCWSSPTPRRSPEHRCGTPSSTRRDVLAGRWR